MKREPNNRPGCYSAVPMLSPAQYSLTIAESWPRTPVILLHVIRQLDIPCIYEQRQMHTKPTHTVMQECQDIVALYDVTIDVLDKANTYK